MNAISFSKVLESPIGFGVAKEVIEASIARLEARIEGEKAGWPTIMSPATCPDDLEYGQWIYLHNDPYAVEPVFPKTLEMVRGLEEAVKELGEQLKEMLGE
jgi:hypothetical protein|tara:strand:+ start:146 stop:448 length:303 start_codon:yes stop_codon:yes gene_type:complete